MEERWAERRIISQHCIPVSRADGEAEIHGSGCPEANDCRQQPRWPSFNLLFSSWILSSFAAVSDGNLASVLPRLEKHSIVFKLIFLWENFWLPQMIADLVHAETALCCKDRYAALESKRKGNECFTSGDYTKALRFYSQVPNRTRFFFLENIIRNYHSRAFFILKFIY